jgi:PAS domain S-box-containing protein
LSFETACGILFQLDKDLLPIFMDGSVEEITGYTKKDFLSGSVKWADIIIPNCLPVAHKKAECATSNPEVPEETEYRVRRKDGKIRWVRERIRQIPDSSGKKGKFQGWIHDITGRKMIEETLKKQEEARIKEIHHRIKNNLQVISSLLDLQAEKFNEKEAVQSKEILKAFKESQDRVICMALIHEELYKSRDMSVLDFANYLQKLTENLLSSYTVKNESINLKLNLEQVYLGMDTAIPLGIIVNELVSNSLKYAFLIRKEGEISISLYKNENHEKVYEIMYEKPADSGTSGSKSERYLQYTLIVADNGRGIPEEVDFENTDSLGLQLIRVLVDQIEGHLELERDGGTKFKINFINK